jgi:Arc/MetJ-type ribon-helix-helix transcriptional regulator
MKLSVSLPEEDLGFVDEYVARTGAASRSAVIHEAIALLRSASLEDAYVLAWDEWEAGGNAEVWDTAVADGVVDASR